METGPAISDLDALDALDASATLAAVEDSLVARRRAEARDLALAAHWSDLHAADPQLGPGGRRERCGEDRLIDVGGDGTGSRPGGPRCWTCGWRRGWRGRPPPLNVSIPEDLDLGRIIPGAELFDILVSRSSAVG